MIFCGNTEKIIRNSYYVKKGRIIMEKLAILGGKAVFEEVKEIPEHLFKWPIITKEDEEGVLEVVRTNNFSGTGITMQFENEFAKWQGREYAVCYTNGTMSLTAAMFAVGLGAGDEIICTTKTYWASITSAQWLGANVVFCGINEMLSMDPDDIEKRITPKTKAIMVVHYLGYPCDMDKIMAIAKKHNLIVIEDVSHAQGGKYKGKKLGTFGDIAAMSLMSCKTFAAGELGILVTDNRKYYERALAFCHYERNNENFITETDDLKNYYHIALGGMKGRVNQVCSVLALGQLKYFDERCAEIRKAINYFWDLLKDIPAVKGIRVDESTGSTMGGFYSPHGLYYPEKLGGLSMHSFCQAVSAEMKNLFISWEGANYCLHTHNYFKTFDGMNLGKPSRIAFTDKKEVNATDEALKNSENRNCFSIPWFKKFDKEWIELYAKAYIKVAENYEQLLPKDTLNTKKEGRWYGTSNV